MRRLELIVLGVGDAFSEHHHPASLLLTYDGFWLAIDCPDMYPSVLSSAARRSARVPSLANIEHVLVTHVHGDHMNGIEGVGFFKRFAESKRLQLVTSPEVHSAIWTERLKASMGTLWNGQQLLPMRFEDYFVHVPLAWETENTVGPFRIRIRRTRHHVPTSALFIEAGGSSLGYSSDTAFDPDLLAFLEPADLIVHETNHGPAHTPYSDLAALPAELRGRMRIIHYPDHFDVEASTITALREGDVLHL